MKNLKLFEEFDWKFGLGKKKTEPEIDPASYEFDEDDETNDTDNAFFYQHLEDEYLEEIKEEYEYILSGIKYEIVHASTQTHHELPSIDVRHKDDGALPYKDRHNMFEIVGDDDSGEILLYIITPDEKDHEPITFSYLYEAFLWISKNWDYPKDHTIKPREKGFSPIPPKKFVSDKLKKKMESLKTFEEFDWFRGHKNDVDVEVKEKSIEEYLNSLPEIESTSKTLEVTNVGFDEDNNVIVNIKGRGNGILLNRQLYQKDGKYYVKSKRED